MDDSTLYIWSEMVPNWVMALSAASAAIVFLWRKQDRKEERERREREIKDGVYAVWATADVEGSGPNQWGVLIVNNLAAPVTHVTVECEGNRQSSEIKHGNLQPGKHFFISLAQGNSRAWAFPSTNFDKLEYISASAKHTTKQISFSYAGANYSRELTGHP